MIKPRDRAPDPHRRVLILDRDAGFALSLRHNLELDGYDVEVADSGAHGLLLARGLRPHLIIMGLLLHESEGRQLLGKLRVEHPTVPVLIAATRQAQANEVVGFRLGLDEFVLRPTSIAEVHSRIEWLLRRWAPADESSSVPLPEGSLRFGDVEIRPASQAVLRSGCEVELRPKEYQLLLALARRNGSVVTRSELLRDVWGYSEDVSSRTVDSHVVRLRQQLEVDPHNPQRIVTVAKVGYRLVR